MHALCWLGMDWYNNRLVLAMKFRFIHACNHPSQRMSIWPLVWGSLAQCNINISWGHLIFSVHAAACVNEVDAITQSLIARTSNVDMVKGRRHYKTIHPHTLQELSFRVGKIYYLPTWEWNFRTIEHIKLNWKNNTWKYKVIGGWFVVSTSEAGRVAVLFTHIL